MNTWTLLGVLGGSLALSFTFWIFVAYGSRRLLSAGVCSVCGAVVSVWALNLAFNFVPGWVTLFLMGQSVVGGSTLLRDTIMNPRSGSMEFKRYTTVTQLLWFCFILGGTFVIGLVGLVVAME